MHFLIVFVFVLFPINTYSGDFCYCGPNPNQNEAVNCFGSCRQGCTLQKDPNINLVPTCWNNIPTKRTLSKQCKFFPTDCISRMHITWTGYKAFDNGHKTNWCKSRGFDSYSGDTSNGGLGDCIRNCDEDWLKKNGCTKAALECLGYVQGHKSKFCKRSNIGYTDAFDPFESKPGRPLAPAGYCWIGEQAKCTFPKPVKQTTPPIHNQKDRELECLKYPFVC